MIHGGRTVAYPWVIWATGELIKSANTNEEYVCVLVRGGRLGRGGCVQGERCAEQAGQRIVHGNERNVET